MSKSKVQVIGDVIRSDEELRLWLVGHMEQHPNLTTAVLSRPNNIGFNQGAIDQYVKGTYFLPKEIGGMGVTPEGSKIEHLVRSYREKVEGTVRHGYANTFVTTRSWKQLETACTTAIEENAIVVVYGKPGIGKTRCLKEYSVNNLNGLAIEILCSRNITTRYFAQKLARELKLDDKQTTAQLEDDIAEKLRRSPRPIFVDQANYLNEKSLGTICYIWEIARCPFVLVGTKDLHDLFTRSSLTEDVRAQLTSRIAMHYPLAELRPEELKGIIQRALGDDATDENIAEIMGVTKGVHRHVEMIFPRIEKLKKSNAEQLTSGKTNMRNIIRKAGARLMTS